MSWGFRWGMHWGLVWSSFQPTVPSDFWSEKTKTTRIAQQSSSLWNESTRLKKHILIPPQNDLWKEK